MNIVGIIPARMAATRFPGKPLHLISGRPMLEHCYERAALFDKWNLLAIATCDSEITNFANSRKYRVIQTADTHTRALDRVAEAAKKSDLNLSDDDIIVCVQGDEPLLGPDMIEAVITPFYKEPEIQGTMLAVPIHDLTTFKNPDIVKIIHDLKGDVLYTSRSPVPYCKKFSPSLGAKRVGGIFGFRWHFLKWFTNTSSSPLEDIESCDSNRICDNGFRQRIAPIPYRPYVSVDSPSDIERVEKVIKKDILWGRY